MDGQIRPRPNIPIHLKPRMRPVPVKQRLADVGFAWMCYDHRGAGFGETQAQAYDNLVNPVTQFPMPV